MVVAILLQPGKADAGALFTTSISSTAFGPRGTQTVLAKITIGAAVAFMLIALTLSIPALTGSRTVLQSQPEPAATPSSSPAATPQSNASPGGSPAQGAAPSPSANTNAAASPAANSSPSKAPEQKK